MSAKTFMLTLVGVSGAGWLWSRGGAASQRDGDDEPLEEEEGESQFPSMDKQRCEEMIGRALERNITVKFMVEKLGEAGCKVDRGFFSAESCGEKVAGGFVPGYGVRLCHNYLGDRTDVEQAMVHELVHAYDQCRAADLDWADLRHHACSEVRAANLSGDCRMWLEALRGHFNVVGGRQVCARRRAQLSVALNDSCSGDARQRANQAAQAVDDVFDECFADTAPFDRAP